jgi:hypothetical protein
MLKGQFLRACRGYFQVIAEDASIQRSHSFHEILAQSVGASFQPSPFGLDLPSFFDPPRRESIVPQKPVRHPHGRILEGIFGEIQWPPRAFQVFESPFFHRLPNLAIRYEMPLVHSFNLPRARRAEDEVPRLISL